jgi:hypothetical protein
MDNITTCVKYNFNDSEEIISNNMKLYCTALNVGLSNFHSNGFSILDNNFKTPQHELLYYLIKSVFDNKFNISIDNYKIIIRTTTESGRSYYDIDFDYGENHDVKTSEGNIINTCVSEFQMDIYFNNSDDNIITIGTNMNKDIKDNEPNIDEIIIFRPQMFSSFTNHHMGTYYFNEINTNIDYLEKGLFKLCVDIINKNTEIVGNYPNISDVFENESDIYKVYDGLYPFFKNKELFVNNVIDTRLENLEFNIDIMNEKIISISKNVYLKTILKKYDYTFEKLYKSMFPGVYSSENFEITYYDKIYENIDFMDHSDININDENRKCAGYQVIPVETKNIILLINNYMKLINVNYIKIIK